MIIASPQTAARLRVLNLKSAITMLPSPSKPQETINLMRFCGPGRPGEHCTLKPAKGKVFNGTPVAIKTSLSKQDVGKTGEKVVIAYLKRLGFKDADHLNAKVNNFPVDLIMDHNAIEVKTGLVSNGATAQHWRATIGQPGKAETEWLKTASSEDKKAWNLEKSAKILERKQTALDQLSKELGRKIKGSTITTILNPDTRTVDIYRFEGFHLRIPWNSPEAKKGYAGSFSY